MSEIHQDFIVINGSRFSKLRKTPLFSGDNILEITAYKFQSILLIEVEGSVNQELIDLYFPLEAELLQEYFQNTAPILIFNVKEIIGLTLKLALKTNPAFLNLAVPVAYRYVVSNSITHSLFHYVRLNFFELSKFVELVPNLEEAVSLARLLTPSSFYEGFSKEKIKSDFDNQSLENFSKEELIQKIIDLENEKSSFQKQHEELYKGVAQIAFGESYKAPNEEEIGNQGLVPVFQALEKIQAKIQSKVDELDRKFKAADESRINLKLNFDEILENVDYAIWSLDLDLNLIDYNQTYEKRLAQVFKLTPEKGVRLSEKLPPKAKEFFQSLYKEVLEKGTASREVVFPIDGIEYWYQFSGRTLHNAKGEITGITIFGNDITLLAQQEIRLREEKARMESLFENLEESLFLVDRNLCLLAANNAYFSQRKKFLDAEIKVGDYILDSLPVEIRKFAHKNYSVALSGQKVVFEKEIHHGNELHIFQVKLNPIWDENGKVTGLSGISRNITEEWMKTKLLEKDKNQVDFIFDNSSDVLVLIDKHDRIQYVSKAVERNFGYSVDEILKKNSYAFIHPIDYETFRLAVAEQVNIQNESTIHTVRIIHKNGNAVWCDLMTNRVYNETGEFERAIFNIRDVSQRIEAQEKLKMSQMLLESVSKNINEGLYRSTPADGLIYFNQAFVSLFGYSESELQANPISVLYQDPERRERLLLSLEENGSVLNEEVTLVKKNGEPFTALISTIRTEDEYGNVYFDGAIRDVSQLKEAEMAIIEAKEAAEKANKLKAEFLASMSHEIRTPLNGVIGMTSLLKHTTLTEEQRDYVDTIKTSGDHLLSIINDILDFSKIESGYLVPEKHPFELSTCLEETLDLFSAKAYEKNLELVYDLDEEVNEYFIGDVTRIRQILVNLVGNAVKFTEKGEVVVSVRNLQDTSTYTLGAKEVVLEFSVRDTGIGISQKDLDKLFKPFSQVDSSNTRKFGGTGLGLVISDKLVRAMGGEIQVMSQVGKGTVFTFTLVLEEQQKKLKRNIDPHKLANLKAIVVDDNPTNLKIIDRLLLNHGVQVRGFLNPLEALEVLKSEQDFHFGIIDMQMPEMDGFGFGEEFQKTLGDKAFPLLLFSSIGDFSALSSHYQKYYKGYLTKPSKPSVILSKIMQVMYKDSAKVLEKSSDLLLKETFAIEHPSRILIAEDNLINQKLVLKLLEKMGYDADVVANGEEVLDALVRKQYDIVFMDVQMPVMDGIEATKKIVAKRWTQKPNIVAMTANAMSGDREKCLEAGMNDYIPKPVRIEEIQKMIIRWGKAN